MQIVHDEHDDLTVGLQPIEQIQQASADGHRVRSRLRLGPWPQLIDDPVREQCLCLVPRNLEHYSVRQRTEEPGKQSRLTSASLALHIDHLRMAHPGGSKPFTEDAQFALPPDEANWGTQRLT